MGGTGFSYGEMEKGYDFWGLATLVRKVSRKKLWVSSGQEGGIKSDSGGRKITLKNQKSKIRWSSRLRRYVWVESKKDCLLLG